MPFEHYYIKPNVLHQDVINDSNSSISEKNQSNMEWIGGHVRNHLFIPAHFRRIFSPKIRSDYSVKSQNNYPDIYGGYGTGSSVGGQGAGHGFQVVPLYTFYT